MADEIDAQLAETKVGLEECAKKQAACRQRFMEASGGFLSEWYDQYVRLTIQSEASHAQSLSDDRMKALKQELHALKESAGEVAREALSNDAAWPGPPKHEVRDYGLPKETSSALRPAMGRVAPLLIRYKFQRASAGSFEQRNSRGPRDEGGYEFVDAFDLNDETRAIVRQFGLLRNEEFKLRKKLGELETKRVQADAVNRWDSI